MLKPPEEIMREISQSSVKNKIRYAQDFISVVATLKNWWIYYLDFFYLIKKSPIVFELWNGKKLYGLPNQWDGLVINEVWGMKNDYIHPPVTISTGDIVVDIGAHKGYFSVYASLHSGTGKVYAFEPFFKNYQILKKNIHINSCKNVKLFQLGIADRKGKKSLYLGHDETKSGFSILKNQSNNYGQSKAVDISVIRLTDIFTLCKINRIDFLKMDIEGAEYDIFFNTPKSVFSKIKHISMEYHTINNMHVGQLKNILQKNKFKVIIKKERKEFGMLYAYRKQMAQ